MDYKMGELVPIVAELTQKYMGCDSTSITYEKAQMLMAGVIYCLNEYRNYSEIGLTNGSLSIKEQYRIGARMVVEKAVDIRNIYNEISFYFDDYNVECLRDTVQKGIPEFLKWYDAKYCPQNTILTLDYPLLWDIDSLSGADAVYTYIHAIKVEQLFLKKFERDYVIEVLRRAIPGYRQMIENVCEIVLLNVIGHAAIGKPFYEVGFHREEYEKIKEVFQSDCIDEIENMLNSILHKLIEQIYDEDQEMLTYLGCAVKNMAVRIKTVIKTQQLRKIFVV